MAVAAAGAAWLLSAGAAAAQGYAEPARGSAERTDILAAMRPLAEWAFGAPVEFVVNDLRLAGDVAFASVTARRPGGAPIDIAASPIVLRDGEDPSLVDGPRVEALLQKSGRMWVPVQSAVGSTDVWYASEAYCPVWKAVLPEVCRA